MGKQEQIRAVISEEIDKTSFPLIEEILEKRIDKVVTILGCGGKWQGWGYMMRFCQWSKKP